jgi:hypothetical protein
MLATFALSLDSLFAGAALGFFGVSKKYWGLACTMVGLADLVALILGRVLSGFIGISMTPSQQVMLFACCAAVAMLLGRACVRHPRMTILGLALLFSIDNLLAGSQSAGLPFTAVAALATGVLSALACFAGLRFASAIAVHLRPRVSFAFASMAVVAGLLVF